MRRMAAGWLLAVVIVVLLPHLTTGFAPPPANLHHGCPPISCRRAVGRLALALLPPRPQAAADQAHRSRLCLLRAAAEVVGEEPMKTTRLPLRDIFNRERNFLFDVAKNIREYEWVVEDEVEGMYTDLVEEMQKGDGASTIDLCSFLLVKGGDEQQAVYQVEDGQQRLVTLCLLFAAIRDSGAALGDEEIRKDVQERLLPTKRKCSLVTPRVRIGHRDSEWYMRILQGDTDRMPTAKKDINKLPSRQGRQILTNYQYYLSRLNGEAPEFLDAFLEFLLGRVTLDLTFAKDAITARKLVINQRKGKNTDPIDLFKGIVVYSVDDVDEQDKYLERWRELEAEGGRVHFTEACLLMAQAYTGKRLRRNGEMDVLEAFWKQQAHLGGGEFFDTILAPGVEHLRSMSDQNSVPFPNPTVEQELQWQFLRGALGSSVPGAREMKLATLYALNKGAMCPALLARLEQMTLHLVAVGSAFNLADRFNRAMALVSCIDAKSDVVPWPELSGAQRQEALAALDRGEWGQKPEQRKIALAVLLRLNQHLLLEKASGLWRAENNTVEHVLPQKPPPKSRWVTDWAAEDRVECLHRLGNLCVLGQRGNSQGKNHDFHEKSTYLDRASGFPLTKEVAKCQTWKRDDMMRQHARILHLVEQVFFEPEP